MFESHNNYSKVNNVTTITFKSWNINEDEKHRFQAFILYNYRHTLIEEITVILPENEEEAAELKAYLDESLNIANESVEDNITVYIKSIIYE